MHSDIAVFRGSTATLSGRAEVDAFRETFGRAILKLEMMPIDHHPLSCDVVIRALPEVAIASGALSPMQNRHPGELGDDAFVLAVLRRGMAEFRQGHRVAPVVAGEGVLTPSAETGTFTGHTATSLTNIRLERQLLEQRVRSPDAAVGTTIPSRQVALHLLLSYSDVLADPALAIDEDAQRVATRNIYDLAALAIGPVDMRANLGGVRAARLHALMAEIRRSLAQPDLSIGIVARRHGISASYARRLFAADGTSFADYLLRQRLSAAHSMLSDPLRGASSISTIAYEVGFSDLSYFNRTFRRSYGMTPSDVRAGTRR